MEVELARSAGSYEAGNRASEAADGDTEAI